MVYLLITPALAACMHTWHWICFSSCSNTCFRAFKQQTRQVCCQTFHKTDISLFIQFILININNQHHAHLHNSSFLLVPCDCHTCYKWASREFLEHQVKLVFSSSHAARLIAHLITQLDTDLIHWEALRTNARRNEEWNMSWHEPGDFFLGGRGHLLVWWMYHEWTCLWSTKFMGFLQCLPTRDKCDKLVGN